MIMECPLINPDLRSYIEEEIIPRYGSFDKAHKEDHACSVIDEALRLAGFYDVDRNMVYAAAAFHDTGLVAGRETHHLVSGRILREDPRLPEWFSKDQIDTIAQAAEDHRASGKTAPRSIYGKIIRTIQFGLEHYPELSREEHWRRFVDHLHEKYYYGGYLKLFLPESRNAPRLEELRKMIGEESSLRELFDKMFDNETIDY